MRSRPLPLVLSLVALLASCKSEEGPDSFVKAAIRGVGGEPQAIWNALPPSYQKDVQGLLAGFAGQMNEQVWNDGFRIGQKTVKVLETRKQFVLGHPMMKGMLRADDVAKGWDPTVRVLSTVMNSELRTLQGVKQLDVEKFLAGPLATVMNDLLESAEVARGAIPGAKGGKDLATLKARLMSAKVTVTREEGDSATIKVEMEGEEPETEEMVKVEGKWVPKSLADSWPKGIASARAALAMVKLEPSMVVQINAMTGAVEPVLDRLLTAKTQEEFNGEIDAVTRTLMDRPGQAIAQAPAGGVDHGDAVKPVKTKVKKDKKKRSRKKSR
jgi:hypothetical protein